MLFAPGILRVTNLPCRRVFTLSKNCNYIGWSWNISCICHVWGHLTLSIEKEASSRIHTTKRGQEKKGCCNRGWIATIPGFGSDRNISYIPRLCHVWYHIRHHDAGDGQRGIITHSYHEDFPELPLVRFACGREKGRTLTDRNEGRNRSWTFYWRYGSGKNFRIQCNTVSFFPENTMCLATA